MPEIRYLTKSRFKIAWDCPTKLFYTNKKKEFADQSIDDPFLLELAKGGFQVGELAKYLFCNDPVHDNITIPVLGYREALEETTSRIEAGFNLIAEAAISHENLFIRADIFHIDQDHRTIKLYEVKAKSISNDVSFLKRDGSIKSDWEEYLIDVAFQKYVISKAYAGYKVMAYLILADKDKQATVEGLNQCFRLVKDPSGRNKVKVKPGLTRADLGEIPLQIINVDDECRIIYNQQWNLISANPMSFEDLVKYFADHYQDDKKISIPVNKKCVACEFCTNPDLESRGLKSGFKECWKAQKNLMDIDFDRQLVLEIWGGLAGAMSHRQNLIDAGFTFLDQLNGGYYSLSGDPKYIGLEPNARRNLQVEKLLSKDPTPYLDSVNLRKEFDSWTYPLHFIDFETSMVAIPFNAGRKPYESIAFQFSHHQVEADGTISHKGQYLHFTPGEFPNFDFVRALKNQLDKDNGTIFRYHMHENTILRSIYQQLTDASIAQVPDRDDLCRFIDLITIRNENKSKIPGSRNMVDLWWLVIAYFYAPQAKGKNGLKYILPAAIENSVFLRNKYSKPIYGQEKPVKSLNYVEKVWITAETGNNPYKTLEPVFDEYSDDQLDELVDDLDGIREGGAAMTAYCKLQFSEVPLDQRQKINEALLRYCELDTLAMVMLYEYWKDILKI